VNLPCLGRAAKTDPIDHLLWIVEVVAEDVLDDADPRHDIVATCATQADAQVIGERWARNDDYALVALFDVDSGEIVMVKGDLEP